MSARYLIIQGIGFVGTIIFFASFQCRKNRTLFRVQFLSYLLYTIHLILLGAVAGGISYIINTFRSLCLGSDYKWAHSKYMCAVICIMQCLALYFCFEGWYSALPIVANIASTIAGYTRNPRKIRVAGMFINSPLWIVYNIIVGSWAGILDEIVSEASMIISIIRYGWKNLNEVECDITDKEVKAGEKL